MDEVRVDHNNGWAYADLVKDFAWDGLEENCVRDGYDFAVFAGALLTHYVLSMEDYFNYAAITGGEAWFTTVSGLYEATKERRGDS